MLEQASREERVREGYYIYGLIDPAALRETGEDDLRSIFYVGKGKGDRWASHEKEVRKALIREHDMLAGRVRSKAERIRKILERGQRIPSIRLSAGYVDQADAFQAESLAIDTIGSLLAAAGRPPLTNAAPGHHAGFLRLGEHFIFTQTSELDLGLAPAEGQNDSEAPGTADTEILVKGTGEDLGEPGQRLGDPRLLPRSVADRSTRVVVIELLGNDHPDARTRRGWDPLDPWTDLEARQRARRYWPIAADRVAGWIDDLATMPRNLLLGISELGGRTVVRYAWEIDRDAEWEYYPKSWRWGIPLGARLHEHPRLGAALYETRDGKRVQVLANYAGGIRVLDTS